MFFRASIPAPARAAAALALAAVFAAASAGATGRNIFVAKPPLLDDQMILAALPRPPAVPAFPGGGGLTQQQIERHTRSASAVPALDARPAEPLQRFSDLVFSNDPAFLPPNIFVILPEGDEPYAAPRRRALQISASPARKARRF